MTEEKPERKSKRGIIYLSDIPPYMNVSQIREYFGRFGSVGRVYLQLAGPKQDDTTKAVKRRSAAFKFTEGWVEFEKKCVAKRVAALLNKTPVSNRKKSKQYDFLWKLKYLSGFKWPHLHARLAYERERRKKKLRTEISLAKKQANFFTSNLRKKKNKKIEETNNDSGEVNSDKEEMSDVEDSIQGSSSSNNRTVDRKEVLTEMFG